MIYLLAVVQLSSLGAILLILWRTEKFLSKALVYMKSNSIHDVLAGASLLEDKPEQPKEDNVIEVTPGQDEETERLLSSAQKKHRQKHVKSLGEEVASQLELK